MYGGSAVCSGREGARYNISGICPDSFMSSTISISKTIDDSTCTIFNVDNGIKYSWRNRVAAYIKDCWWC